MERDDIIEYSLDIHHSEEEGKKIRKKIWMVFWILLIVTTLEVVMGIYLAGKEFFIQIRRTKEMMMSKCYNVHRC